MTEPAVVSQPSLEQLRAEAMEWAQKPRGRGAWYVTEHMVRAMRAYGWTIIVSGLGQPIVYLLGVAVGLAALIQAPDPGRRPGGVLPRVRRAGAADDVDDRHRERGVHVSRHVGVQVAAVLLRLQRVAPLVPADRDRCGLRRHRADGRRRGGLRRLPLPLRRDSGPVPRVADDLRRPPRRTGVRHPADGVRRVDRRRQGPVRPRAAVPLHADVPLLRHVLPPRDPSAVAAVDRVGLAAVARVGARPVPDLRPADRPGDALHPRRLSRRLEHASATSSARRVFERRLAK